MPTTPVVAGSNPAGPDNHGTVAQRPEHRTFHRSLSPILFRDECGWNYMGRAAGVPRRSRVQAPAGFQPVAQ
jgi:hypothetical protein